MIGQTISHYRILSLLGEGGMGAVYMAEDTRLGRRVAVKIPHAAPAADNSHHARFLREARSISHLSHRNIATVYDYGETPDGHPFIVMELVEGHELGELLRDGGLTLQRAVEIVCEVAEALAEAHLQGVIHRDVKPSNVVVNSRGAVKVLDFGLAKVLSEGHTNLTSADETLMKFRTRSDVLLGTPLYLSPEQAKGVEVDPRSDLFALGALLYECVAGRPAFSGATVMEIAGQIIHVDPPPPSSFNPSVPAELDRVTMKALAKRPADRYQSAGEMVEDLRRVHAQLGSNGNGHAAAAPVGARTVAMAPQPSTQARTSAIMTLSENLRQPRVSFATLIMLVVAGLGAFAGFAWMTRGSVHEPAGRAVTEAEKGAAEMRDGAYWHASKTLRGAIEADGNYALAHARLAEALMELDETERAAQELLLVRKLVPDPSTLPERDRLYLDAVTATATRDFSAAVAAYEQIARRWPGEAAVYVDLGRAYERREQTEDVARAVKAYTEATRHDADYAAAYLRLGNLRTRRREMESAKPPYDRAEEIYLARGNAEGRAEVHYRRGLMLRLESKLAQARDQLQQAFNIAHTNGYDAKQILTLLQLSAVATNENNSEQAADYANRAIKLAQDNQLINLAALGFVDLGITYLAARNYEEADKHLRLGLDYARRSRALRTEAKGLGNLGSMYVSIGRTDEGVRLAEQALAFYQSSGYQLEAAQTLLLLARARRDKGDYEEAMRVFAQQLETAQRVGDAGQAALLHGEIAATLVRQGRYTEALARYESSYQIDLANKYLFRLPDTMLNRADVLARLGRYKDARAALAELSSYALRRDHEAERHMIQAVIALGERDFGAAKAEAAKALALAGKESRTLLVRVRLAAVLADVYAGRAAAARPAAEAALAAAREVGDPWLISNAQLAAAEMLYAAGDAPGALAAARESQSAFERAGNREPEWRAWLVAARASLRLGKDEDAREAAARSARALSEIQQAWGAEVFDAYQARQDVQLFRKQLAELPQA